MFKLTGRGGRRNANPSGGAAQASRRIISPFNKFRNTVAPVPHAPAFQDYAQDHAFDSSSPRLQGLEQKKNLPTN